MNKPTLKVVEEPTTLNEALDKLMAQKNIPLGAEAFLGGLFLPDGADGCKVYMMGALSGRAVGELAVSIFTGWIMLNMKPGKEEEGAEAFLDMVKEVTMKRVREKRFGEVIAS